jgi:hypothetical protein
MAEIKYCLQVPLTRRHWVTLISNRPMTPSAWEMFEKHLELQREISAEDEAEKPAEEASAEIQHDPV